MLLMFIILSILSWSINIYHVSSWSHHSIHVSSLIHCDVIISVTCQTWAPCYSASPLMCRTSLFLSHAAAPLDVLYGKWLSWHGIARCWPSWILFFIFFCNTFFRMSKKSKVCADRQRTQRTRSANSIWSGIGGRDVITWEQPSV